MPYNETTTQADLFDLLEFMEQHGVKVWVHGGWALEALTGHPRPHKDIDLLAEDTDRAKLVQVLGSRVVAEHLHKLEVNFNGAEVDLVFFHRNGQRAYTVTPRIIATWSPGFLDAGKGSIAGRDIPVVSARTLYIQVANPVRKKADMLEKNRRDLALLDGIISQQEKAEAVRYFPRENTLMNRMKLHLGL